MRYVHSLASLLIALVWFLGLFTTVRVDMEGRAAVKPGGYKSVRTTIIIFIVLGLLHWQSGAFSGIGIEP